MEQVTPRWEWRTFGTAFGEADEKFDALEASPVHESEELYILAANADIVKLRDGLIDIKSLRAVHPRGLEQWMPILKAEFPLTASDVIATCKALRRPAPDEPKDGARSTTCLPSWSPPPRASPPFRSISTASAIPSAAAWPSAARSTSPGAGSGRSPSRTRIRTRSSPRSVSIGLGAQLNTNYAAGIRRLLAETPPRYAVIDVGTNSVKLHVAERARRRMASGHRPRGDHAAGRGPERPAGHRPEAVERTATVIAGMVAEARRRRPRDRRRRHRRPAHRQQTRAVVAELERAAGSGSRSSRARRRAASRTLARRQASRRPGRSVVFDTGGGSSQFTFGTGAKVDGALQPERRRGQYHRAIRPGRGRLAGGAPSQPRRSNRRGPRPRSRAATRRRRSSAWVAPSRT